MGKNERGEAISNPAPIYPKLSFTGTVKLHGGLSTSNYILVLVHY